MSDKKETYRDGGRVYDEINKILVDYAALSTENSSDLSPAEKAYLKRRKKELLDKVKPLDLAHWEMLTAYQHQNRKSDYFDWLAKQNFNHEDINGEDKYLGNDHDNFTL